MEKNFRKITLVKINKVKSTSINDELKWFSYSLGLFRDRDKEKSCFRVFIELIKSSRAKRGLSSDQLAQRSNLSRATIIHHLNKLIEAGLIVNKDNKYYLRSNNLYQIVENIEIDLSYLLKELKEVAQELDKELYQD